VGAAHTSIGLYAVCLTIPATKLNETAVSQAKHMVDVINRGRGEGHLRRSLRLADEMPWGVANVLGVGQWVGQVHAYSAPVLQSSHFLVESQGYAQTVEAARQEIITAFDFINFETTRTTELVVSRIDPETKRFDCHVTKFRFNKTCAEDCFRTPASCANAFASYVTRGSSRGITPDYRPEPVLGAFTWLEPLGLSLGIERDVLEVRQMAVKELKKLIDTSNNAFNEHTSLRLHLLHYAGLPAMPTFDSTLKCTSHGAAGCFRTNLENNEIVLINYNCIHCMRQPLISADSIEYLTDLRLSTDCHEGNRRKCTAASRKLSEIHRTIMSSQGLITSTRDYTGHEVMIGHSFINNLNVALYAKMNLQEVEGPIGRMTRDSALSGVALCIAGLVVVMMICGGMLSRIERDLSELAESVASMEFHSVSYLDDIQSPTRIQSAFIKIVSVLKLLRPYLPQHLLVPDSPRAKAEEEGAKAEEGGKAPSSKGSSKGSLKAASVASSKVSSSESTASEEGHPQGSVGNPLVPKEDPPSPKSPKSPTITPIVPAQNPPQNPEGNEQKLDQKPAEPVGQKIVRALSNRFLTRNRGLSGTRLALSAASHLVEKVVTVVAIRCVVVSDVTVMQKFIQIAVQAVRTTHGICHSYRGGILLATWTRGGSMTRPNIQAVKAAMEAMEKLQKEGIQATYGIDASQCLTGNIGTQDTLMFNELHGDAVHTAMTLCDLAKELDATVLLTDAVCNDCTHGLISRFVGYKRAQSDTLALPYPLPTDVPLFQALQLRTSEKSNRDMDDEWLYVMQAEQKIIDSHKVFENGIELFYEGKRDEAYAVLEQVVAKDAADLVAKKYLSFRDQFPSLPLILS